MSKDKDRPLSRSKTRYPVLAVEIDGMYRLVEFGGRYAIQAHFSTGEDTVVSSWTDDRNLAETAFARFVGQTIRRMWLPYRHVDRVRFHKFLPEFFGENGRVHRPDSVGEVLRPNIREKRTFGDRWRDEPKQLRDRRSGWWKEERPQDASDIRSVRQARANGRHK